MAKQVWDEFRGIWVYVDEAGNRYLEPPNGPPKEPTVECLFLYGPIRNNNAAEPGCVTAGSFMKAVRETPACDELHLYIDSEGGHTAALTKMMEAFSRHPSRKKVTHVVGKCFSAAAAMFLLGDERLMCPETALMLHDVHRSGVTTDADSIEYSDAICDLFAHRLPDIPRGQLREWQHRETYFDYAAAWSMRLATGLDLQSTPRISVDSSRCSQPRPTTDFSATRAFDAKVPRQPKQQTVREAHDQQQPRRQPVEFPEMPESLVGFAVASMGDIATVLARANTENACRNSSDPEWRARALAHGPALNQMAKLSRRLQANPTLVMPNCGTFAELVAEKPWVAGP